MSPQSGKEAKGETTGPIVRINCRDLARVLPFMALDDMRYYLNGVYVEPVADGCILVATDGHRLGAIRSSASFSAQPVIVRASNQFADLVRSAAYDADVIVDEPKGQARIVLNGVEKFVQAGTGLIDGKYPDWRRVIPKEEELAHGLPGAVNARYLKSFIDVAANTSGYRGDCIYFSHKVSAGQKPEDAVIVARADGEPELVMCLMPMRFDRKLIPTWTRPVSVPEASVATESAEVAS